MHVVPLVALASLAAIEAYGSMSRFASRTTLYQKASERAALLGRPLVVVGDPDGGAHTRLKRAYDCGDICLDLNGCNQCPVQHKVDLTQGPNGIVADDSAVVFVSCVLEYVGDYDKAAREILRMAGSPDNVFVAYVQDWTATAALYPGANWSLRPTKNPSTGLVDFSVQPVSASWSELEHGHH